MLGRPIIVGVDSKAGGVHAHQVKRKAVGTHGWRHELQQTLKNWDTEDQEWSCGTGAAAP